MTTAITAPRQLRWYDHIAINIYALGLSFGSASLTPIITPYLVALFVLDAVKNTSLAQVRVIGLAVAMLMQPLAGMLSDRSTSRWGRRRPFILGGTIFNLLFLALIAATPLFLGPGKDSATGLPQGAGTAFIVLIVATILMQISNNVAMGGMQGLIPDLVPEEQRGRSSGVKAVMELLPSLLVFVLGIGGMVQAGRSGLAIAVVGAFFLVTMLVTVIFVREEPLRVKPAGLLREPILRLVALTVIFVGITQGAVWLTGWVGDYLAKHGAAVTTQVAVVGVAGLLGMAGSIFIGVYLGAWVGIGKEARSQRSFIWWVINRLLFLAAVGSISAFAQYFLKDVLQLPDAAKMTTLLLAIVAIFLIPAALGGGYLADRIGRKRLVALGGVVAAAGTLLLLFSRNIPLVMVSGSIIGLGAGVFMATNWALGTDLVPPQEAGRYMGISNLAGAGAGIVGAGIGGPMADFFNKLQPGLGYLVIFGIYGALFLLSVVALGRVVAGRDKS